jgi:hypothetical protein
MLGTVNEQRTLWETILPEALPGLPSELQAVDRLLDDPRFFEPDRAYSTRRSAGRSSRSGPIFD